MIAEAVTAVGNAIAKVFGFASQETDLKNAPDVRAAEQRQSEVDEMAKDVKAVADGNLDEMRKRTSE